MNVDSPVGGVDVGVGGTGVTVAAPCCCVTTTSTGGLAPSLLDTLMLEVLVRFKARLTIPLPLTSELTLIAFQLLAVKAPELIVGVVLAMAGALL